MTLAAFELRKAVGGDRRGLRARLKAFAVHSSVSAAAAGCVLAIVYLAWYRGPLESVSGVGDILLVLIGVDMVLGPVLTFAIFDRRKKALKFDLACIALLQLLALAYGVYTVDAGRPHYLVFVRDRFEVVSLADLHPLDRKAASGNRAAGTDWLGPRVVAAEMPTSNEVRQGLLLESIQGGRDLQHLPEQYRDYASQSMLAASKGLSLNYLRELNPEHHAHLDEAISRSGLHASRLVFLPIKGPRGDATMLINGSTGETAGMVALRPWR